MHEGRMVPCKCQCCAGLGAEGSSVEAKAGLADGLHMLTRVLFDFANEPRGDVLAEGNGESAWR